MPHSISFLISPIKVCTTANIAFYLFNFYIIFKATEPYLLYMAVHNNKCYLLYPIINHQGQNSRMHYFDLWHSYAK